MRTCERWQHAAPLNTVREKLKTLLGPTRLAPAPVMLRGSIRFSPSPRATHVEFLLSNTELASCTRVDFDRFWNVWLSAPRLQALHLEFAVGDCGTPAAFEGINRFLEHFVFHVRTEEIKPRLTFHLNNWTELDEKKLTMKEVLEAPVELYNSQKQGYMRFVATDDFTKQVPLPPCS